MGNMSFFVIVVINKVEDCFSEVGMFEKGVEV